MSVCISYEPKKFESKAYILAIVIIQSIVGTQLWVLSGLYCTLVLYWLGHYSSCGHQLMKSVANEIGSLLSAPSGLQVLSAELALLQLLLAQYIPLSTRLPLDFYSRELSILRVLPARHINLDPYTSMRHRGLSGHFLTTRRSQNRLPKANSDRDNHKLQQSIPIKA